MKRERKIFFVNGWLNSLVGNQKSPEALKVVNGFLESPALDPDLRLKVVEVKDGLERIVRIRSRFGGLIDVLVSRDRQEFDEFIGGRHLSEEFRGKLEFAGGELGSDDILNGFANERCGDRASVTELGAVV